MSGTAEDRGGMIKHLWSLGPLLPGSLNALLETACNDNKQESEIGDEKDMEMDDDYLQTDWDDVVIWIQ